MSPILIVDDEPKIRKFLRIMLEKAGYQIVEASNGKECINLCKSAPPAIVLMDIMMPELDGISTLREIKKMKQAIKVIAISGGSVFTPEVYLDEAVCQGADYCLSKPIDREELIKAIEELQINLSA
jgi:CheY-like chemotaxis protein